MDLMNSGRVPLDFLRSRAVIATLSMMGASCVHSRRPFTGDWRDEHRPSRSEPTVDRRRKPSGEDDQHLYTLNI